MVDLTYWPTDWPTLQFLLKFNLSVLLCVVLKPPLAAQIKKANRSQVWFTSDGWPQKVMMQQIVLFLFWWTAKGSQPISSPQPVKLEHRSFFCSFSFLMSTKGISALPAFLWSLNNRVGGSLAILHTAIQPLVEFIYSLNPPKFTKIGSTFLFLNELGHLVHCVVRDPSRELGKPQSDPTFDLRERSQTIDVAEGRIDNHRIALHSDMPQAKIT